MSTTTTTTAPALDSQREILTPSKTTTMPRQKGHKELVAQEKMLISLKANMLDLVIENVCEMLPRLGEKIEKIPSYSPELKATMLCAAIQELVVSTSASTSHRSRQSPQQQQERFSPQSQNQSSDQTTNPSPETQQSSSPATPTPIPIQSLHTVISECETEVETLTESLRCADEIICLLEARNKELEGRNRELEEKVKRDSGVAGLRGHVIKEEEEDEPEVEEEDEPGPGEEDEPECEHEEEDEPGAEAEAEAEELKEHDELEGANSIIEARIEEIERRLAFKRAMGVRL